MIIMKIRGKKKIFDFFEKIDYKYPESFAITYFGCNSNNKIN